MDLLKIFLATVLLIPQFSYAKELLPNTFEQLKTIHLKNDLKRPQKLIYFWASWCPDCRGKLRSELRDLKKQNIDIVTINVDRNEKKGKRFIEEEKLPFPVLRDEKKSLRKQLAIFAVPAWAVLRKSKKRWIVVKSASGSNMEEIKKSLELSQ